MKTSHLSILRDRRPAAAGGFSLVEIIIVVGLLSVIMLGLLAMFDQTQRAFRTSMTQTDVLESGRAVTALLNSSLEQITPSRYGSNTINFYMTNYGSTLYSPVLQALPGLGNVPRTNIMESIFFLSRDNQQWVGTGYIVGTPAAGFGTLYRYINNCPVSQDPIRLFDDYQTIFYRVWTNTDGNLPSFISKLVDGVVHFKVRVSGTNGFLITNSIPDSLGVTNITMVAPDDVNLGGEARNYFFTDEAVPGAVEFELGVLEDRSLRRLQAIPDPTGTFQRRYLTNQVGTAAVHIFRQRVPIYNMDPSAYR